ncbi:hypothetical protein Tco_0259850 [Tanacetum coccineum]
MDLGRSVAEDASPDYNSDSEAARFSSWAVPGSLAVTKGILRSPKATSADPWSALFMVEIGRYYRLRGPQLQFLIMENILANAFADVRIQYSKNPQLFKAIQALSNMKRYESMKVVEASAANHTVTNQTPLMHLSGHHPKPSILEATRSAQKPCKPTKSQTTPELLRSDAKEQETEPTVCISLPIRYDVRGAVGAGLRRASKLGQVATTCEETVGAGLRRARKVGPSRATTCVETVGDVYDVRGPDVPAPQTPHLTCLPPGFDRRRALGPKEWLCPASDSRHNRTRVKLDRSVFPVILAKPVPLAVVSLDSRQDSGNLSMGEITLRRAPERAFPVPSRRHADDPSRHVKSRAVRDSRRSCSPWRLMAVIGSTTGVEDSVPPDYQGSLAGASGTPRDVRCFPAAGPTSTEVVSRVGRWDLGPVRAEDAFQTKFDSEAAPIFKLTRSEEFYGTTTSSMRPSQGTPIWPTHHEHGRPNIRPNKYSVRGDAMRDAQADVPRQKVLGNLVQKLDGSRDSAIHTKYRILRGVRTDLPQVHLRKLVTILPSLNDKVQCGRHDPAIKARSASPTEGRVTGAPINQVAFLFDVALTNGQANLATTCEEPSGQVYVVRGNLVKSLRRARNRRGRFTSCEETWSSRYDVRGTVGAGLRRARKLGQVATTCEEPLGASLRREETWSSRYDVQGTVGAGLRHARKVDQVATTWEEPSGLVYVVRGNLVKSLRRARNRRGRFTSCDETWSTRYDMRVTVEAGLLRPTKLGQVATMCEEPSGQVYVMRRNLVKSLRRARNRQGRFTSCEDTWSVCYTTGR